MGRTRKISVRVPDNDEAEQAARHLAFELCEGYEVIVLRRPHGITNEEVPSLERQFTDTLNSRALCNQLGIPFATPTESDS